MSNIIPPLLSDTPPPPPDVDDHDEDEFGDFAGTCNFSYDYEDSCSLPESPIQLPKESFEPDRDFLPPPLYVINSNSKEIVENPQLENSKDFHDKRKTQELNTVNIKTDVNTMQTNTLTLTTDSDTITEGTEHHTTVLKVEHTIFETNCDKNSLFRQQDVTNSNTEVEKVFVKHEDFSMAPALNCSPNLNPVEKQSQETSNTDSIQLSEYNTLNSDFESSNSLSVESVSIMSSPKDVKPNTFEDYKDDNVSAKVQDVFADLIAQEIDCKTVIRLETSQLPPDAGYFGPCDTQSFANFTTFTKQKSPEVSDEEDDFDDFATFTSATQEPISSMTFIDNNDDDFGDFAATPVFVEQNEIIVPNQSCKLLLLDEKQVLDKSTEIFNKMFPILQQNFENFEYKGLEEGDKIFDRIKNITDTHALAFQWPKSASQTLLLKALNIDSRNIIHGPCWNLSSMPRFAATLSVTPLKPVKSEILTPVPVSREINNIPGDNLVVKTDSLEFNLATEGLTETTDYSSQAMLLDLEQLVAQLEIPICKSKSSPHNLSSPSKEFDSWEDWLESVSSEESQVIESKTNAPVTTKLNVGDVKNSITPLAATKVNLEQKSTNNNKSDDFDGFVSYLPATDQSHNILLRETHISNKDSKTEDNDIVNWLEPTIVTPELSRKERQFIDGDDEIEDFQLVVSNEDNSKSKYCSSDYLTVKPVLEPQSVTIPKEELALGLGTDRNEDEFGDFTFSLPANKPSVVPPAAILEPLKPVVVLNSGSNVSSISWPDPGITDDEISRLEAYSRAQNKESDLIQKQVNQTSNKGDKLKRTASSSKQSSLEDDEWSDFVSVQSQSPLHKLKSEKERSSTPDLPLSVLNLGTVQPTRQPIPVITPNGLVQTKISSSNSVTMPTIRPQPNRFYPQPQIPNNPYYQPSIISNQYATQAYGGFNTSTNNNFNRPMTTGDEDEWSDFVSHQATGSTQPHQLSNWITTSPNIISNPTANSNLYQSKQVKKVSGRGNGAVPNMLLPDLDFLAPKTRTTQRK